MIEIVIEEVTDKMDKAIESLKKGLSKLRTGRASTGMLDGIMVNYFGSMTPLNQLATVNVPEPRMITIQPWDQGSLGAIEKTIMSSDLGLTPNNDGKIIRINFPQLTEERRKELVKIAKKYGEESKVSVRNARRDGNEEIKKLEKDKEISQDDMKKHQEDVQKLTDAYILKVDKILETKEKDILEV